MTKQKDLKRVVRERMKKTGESYTAARAHIVDQQKPPRPAKPKAEWPKLAGTSDAVLKEKTGETWHGWVVRLDGAVAWQMKHRDIARLVRELDPDVSGWWAQTITVGYERIRGLRDVGQKRSGAYEANKSRTYGVDVSTLYRMFAESRRRNRWLDGGFVKVRTSTKDKSMRIDWEGDTQVNLYFEAKGADKSRVSVQHTKLGAKADIESAKASWQARLDALADVL